MILIWPVDLLSEFSDFIIRIFASLQELCDLCLLSANFLRSLGLTYHETIFSLLPHPSDLFFLCKNLLMLRAYSVQDLLLSRHYLGVFRVNHWALLLSASKTFPVVGAVVLFTARARAIQAVSHLQFGANVARFLSFSRSDLGSRGRPSSRGRGTLEHRHGGNLGLCHRRCVGL